jgi:hypothetical protein
MSTNTPTKAELQARVAELEEDKDNLEQQVRLLNDRNSEVESALEQIEQARAEAVVAAETPACDGTACGYKAIAESNGEAYESCLVSLRKRAEEDESRSAAGTQEVEAVLSPRLRKVIEGIREFAERGNLHKLVEAELLLREEKAVLFGGR